MQQQQPYQGDAVSVLPVGHVVHYSQDSHQQRQQHGGINNDIRTAPSVRNNTTINNENGFTARYYQFQQQYLQLFQVLFVGSIGAFGIATLVLIPAFAGGADVFGGIMKLNVTELNGVRETGAVIDARVEGPWNKTAIVYFSFREAVLRSWPSHTGDYHLKPESIFSMKQQDEVKHMNFVLGDHLITSLSVACGFGFVAQVVYFFRCRWPAYRCIFTAFKLTCAVILLWRAEEAFTLATQAQSDRNALWYYLFEDHNNHDIPWYLKGRWRPDVKSAVYAAQWERNFMYASLVIVVVCLGGALCLDLVSLVLFIIQESCFPPNVHRFERIPAHEEEDDHEMMGGVVAVHQQQYGQDNGMGGDNGDLMQLDDLDENHHFREQGVTCIEEEDDKETAGADAAAMMGGSRSLPSCNKKCPPGDDRPLNKPRKIQL